MSMFTAGSLGLIGGLILPLVKIIVNSCNNHRERIHKERMKAFEIEELKQKVALAKIQGNSELKSQMIEANKEVNKSEQ